MDSTLRTFTDSDNILTLLVDVPGKPVNTCTPQLLEDLSAALDQIQQSQPAGIIIASAKPHSFNAGADLFTMRDLDPDHTAQFIARGQEIFDRIARLPMPTIAAINGDCLGGGMELALACTYRVAADDPSISIGLPEVKLGLIPAWGGTTRLPRLIGLAKALPILLAGKTLPPRKAMKAGLIDEVVRPETLIDAARRIVSSHRDRQRPRFAQRVAGRLSPVRNRIIGIARRTTTQRTAGNYPAPLRLLEVVKAGYDKGMPAGLAAEREAIGQLIQTPACRNLLRLFFLRQGAKRRAADQLRAKAAEVQHAAVIGGGTMGAGIVHALVRAGIPVRLVEVSPAAVSAALGRIRKLLDDDIAAGKLDKLAAHHAFNRVSPTTDWTGLGLADIVIEAVLETFETKRVVFTRLDGVVRPDAVLATNTSSLRVADIAAATAHPQRIVGLHFFNPVNKMPLVEIVRAPGSDDASLAVALGLASRIGKTPVIVNDSAGFLVNRLLIPYLAEALMMGTQGVDVRSIDQAMEKWGMPMGPFELLDEIGLDVAVHVLRSLAQFHSIPVPPAIDTAIANGWLGKKSGKGFYIHSDKRSDHAARKTHDELISLLASRPAQVQASQEDIQWRLILPMINEAARVLDEGVTSSADDIDLATVLGIGFAPFRGGLARFAEDTGLDEIVKRMDEVAGRLGPRFAPAQSLRRFAAARNGFPRPATAPKSQATPTAGTAAPDQSPLQEVHSA